MSSSGTFALWGRLAAMPGGRQLFSAAMCMRVPYFRTVLPTVRQLKPGRCVVTAPKWWGVYNHIGTFHAIAACNLAEVAMGMLAEATVPDSHRWLPKRMSVDYVAKAETGLTVVAEVAEIPDFTDEGVEIDVPVTVSDKNGKSVVTGTITIWVTPRK